MMALYWELPVARAPLKLGQKSHRNRVPAAAAAAAVTYTHHTATSRREGEGGRGRGGGLTDHGKEVRVVGGRVARMFRGFLVVEHQRDGYAKVGPKGVDDHGAPHVCRLEHMDVERLIGRVAHELKEGDDDQLEGAGPPQHRPHSDQHCRRCKV